MRSKGFTLMEIVMAMAVFLVGTLGVLGVFFGISALSESSRNLTQAMADAQTVLEAMRDSSAQGLGAVTGTNWSAWAQANGLTSLGGETVTVTFANPANDPLTVTLRLDWQEKGRNRAVILDTLMTQR